MKFGQELRRRRVYRLAGLYIVGAWLVIQVTEMLFQAWGVPESALRYLFLAATAGFPVALTFSWFYDITIRGIVRTEAAGGTGTVNLKLKRADYIVLAALLAVGLTILLGSAEKSQEEIDAAPSSTSQNERRENSIAVLPFVNLATNPDTGYFSDGVTDEILMRLSSLRVLHVLGQTSSFAFRNSTDGPARISEILGEIVPPGELSAGRTTTNMEAYNEYLFGKAFVSSRVPGWVEAAVAAFRRAIDLDDAWRFAEQSLVLDPLLAEGHAIAGLLLSDKDPVGAEKYLRRALELDPTSGTACNWLAIALYNQGRMAESGAAQDKGLETFEQQTKVTYPDIPPSAAKDLGWLNILAGNYSFGIELLEPDVNIESLEGLAPFFINRGLQELERLHALVFAYEKVGRDDAARGLLL